MLQTKKNTSVLAKNKCLAIITPPKQKQNGLRSLVNVVKRIKKEKKTQTVEKLTKQNTLLCIMRRKFVETN